jgi:hypothetical protein
MSYLLQHLPRPAGSASPGVRLDLDVLLNRPGFYADAHIRAFVEDTSGRKLHRWGCNPPAPLIELEITDCVNAIHLEFELSSAGARENALFKVDTLIASLTAFRAAVAAEADLYEQREGERRRRRTRPLLHARS